MRRELRTMSLLLASGALRSYRSARRSGLVDALATAVIGILGVTAIFAFFMAAGGRK